VGEDGESKAGEKELGTGLCDDFESGVGSGVGWCGEGVYLEDCQVTTKLEVVAGYALDEENATRCWRLAEEMVGESFEH